ncbi:MAG TPA: heme-degrading domain-containing protein [Amnibacterium sp.]|jgi:uncharacterized protein (UPF0303 family)|nr:heme-degrading domain-containing protein [Amnibacterium sp.]
MVDFPPLEELLADEEELQFSTFTLDDAWALGSLLRRTAVERGLGVAMDVRRGAQQVFHAALPGSSADNDDWIRRKTRVVERFGHSSLAVGQQWRERGTTFEAGANLDPSRYAAAGGSFPVIVRSVGPVGTVTVSGLPQLEDHRLVVGVIRAHLAQAAGAR